jgi:hypothetical protein
MLKRFYCSCDKQIKKIFNDLKINVIPLNMIKDEGPSQKDIEHIDKEINKKVQMIIDINNDLIYKKEN